MFYKTKVKPPQTKFGVYDQNSPFQNIRFEHTNCGLVLFLDGKIQFVESDEKIYHDALAGVPFGLKKKSRINRVLILGGGDGLAARTIFKHNSHCRVLICELDSMVITACSSLPEMRKLNRDSLMRCEIFIQDAKITVPQLPSMSYDLVISDLPDLEVGTMDLYGPRMFYHVSRVLKNGGIFSIYPGGLYTLISEPLNECFVKISESVINLESMGKTPIVHLKKR